MIYKDTVITCYISGERGDYMEKFFLEEPSIERKDEAINYINEFLEYNSQINGVGGLDSYLDDYEGWLQKLEEDYLREPNEDKVPARTYFLVRLSDNKIVGMINIRLVLNEKLRQGSGHIGYSIRPTERRKGYNKINLYLGLKVLQEHGETEAMLSCVKSNLGSAKTMLALGAKLQKEYYSGEYQEIEQVYTIDINESLEQYKDIYDPCIYKRTK